MNMEAPPSSKEMIQFQVLNMPRLGNIDFSKQAKISISHDMADKILIIVMEIK